MSGISFRELEPHDRYKLCVACRAAADRACHDARRERWRQRARSFSQRLLGRSPLVVLGLQHKADFTPKDTTRNIHRSGQFVVHLVTRRWRQP